jgi:hypothetical protein
MPSTASPYQAAETELLNPDARRLTVRGNATSVSYAVDNGDLTNVLMLAAGVVLMPIWLVWSSRPADRAENAQGGSIASRSSDASSLVSP